MSTRKIKGTDMAVRAAKWSGAGKVSEYRVERSWNLILACTRPVDGDGESTKIWRCAYGLTISGRPVRRRMRLGTYPAMSLAEAREASAAIMARVERGEDPFLDAQARRRLDEQSALTFSDLVSEYLEAHEHLASLTEIRRELERDVIGRTARGDKPAVQPAALAAMRPSEIRDADVQFMAEAAREREADHLAYRLVSRVSSIFNWARYSPLIRDKYGISGNPAEPLLRGRRGASKLFPKGSAKDRALCDEEIVLLLRAIRGVNQMPLATKTALQLVLATAQRPGEVRQMRWDDLQLDGPEPLWTIPDDMVKNRKGVHRVPLSPLALSLIESMRHAARPSQYVMPWTRCISDEDLPASKKVLPMALRFLFENHLGDLKPATPHDLRRTAATGMRRLKVPRETVSLILNHASVGVTAEVYDRYEALPERRAALVAWGAHLQMLLNM